MRLKRESIKFPGGMAEDDTARNSPIALSPRRESSFDSGHFNLGVLARQFSFRVKDTSCKFCVATCPSLRKGLPEAGAEAAA